MVAKNWTDFLGAKSSKDVTLNESTLAVMRGDLHLIPSRDGSKESYCCPSLVARHLQKCLRKPLQKLPLLTNKHVHQARRVAHTGELSNHVSREMVGRISTRFVLVLNSRDHRCAPHNGYLLRV